MQKGLLNVISRDFRYSWHDGCVMLKSVCTFVISDREAIDIQRTTNKHRLRESIA